MLAIALLGWGTAALLGCFITVQATLNSGVHDEVSVFGVFMMLGLMALTAFCYIRALFEMVTRGLA